jgi:MoxR-like ATPase
MAKVSRIESSSARTAQRRGPDVFARLGVHGLGAIAPVLLAALSIEEPLLLIGPHGTGKTLLLTRISEALGLAFRHYNASLLNFDDLVGFPLPGPGGTLEYVRTPAAIWGAEAVLFDEISRCRPEVQNKIFPVVHERRVQGILLTELRHRWAAMNPPAGDDDDGGYVGSEPLDAALADRFTFVVRMPEWGDLTDAAQLEIIGAPSREVDPAAVSLLRCLIQATRATHGAHGEGTVAGLAGYVQILHRLLAQAGIVLSPRRAAMLCRSALAVHAASVALDAGAELSDSVWLALQHGLPQRAEGRPVPDAALLAAHREAWRLASVPASDPLKAILMTKDPLERVRLAIGAKMLKKGEFSTIVSDAMAALPPGPCAALVVHLFETDAAGRLVAAVAEKAAELYGDIAVALDFSLTLHASQPRYRAWSRLKDLLSRLDPSDPRAHLCANALVAWYARGKLDEEERVQQAFDGFREVDARLHGRLAA